MSTSRLRSIAASIALFLVSLLVALGLGEGVVRLSNSSMRSYDIEMWRYARELKLPSDNPILGHEHVKNASSRLQSVDIRFNNMGLRGPPVSIPPKADRRILFLGSSVTLGWGVAEQDTVTARLERMFTAAGQRVAVLNAGIGNYNAERYVERYLTRLIALQPTDIVLHVFVNDGEILKPGGGNILIRNSQLAATAWILASRMLGGTGDEKLTQYYRRTYAPESTGRARMAAALSRLAEHARARGIRVLVAMTPDFHDLEDYKLGFVHRAVGDMAASVEFGFVDLFDAFQGIPAKSLWAIPGDPHPNAEGHRIMAEFLYSYLAALPSAGVSMRPRSSM